MKMDQHLQKLKISNKTNPPVCTGQKSFGSTDKKLSSYSPVDAKEIGSIGCATSADYKKAHKITMEAFDYWRHQPAPKRGEIVRQYGNKLREYKDALGHLVSYEMGKSLQEGLGEVQEMIDICDFAVGLSRQLYGLTMHSESCLLYTSPSPRDS